MLSKRDSYSGFFQQFMDRINHRWQYLSGRSDEQIRNEFAHVSTAIKSGGNILGKEFIVNGFGLICTAIERSLGLRPYEEQIVAGIGLIHGMVCEMQTGEGKTITTLFPACYRTLGKNKVHVATVNTYLAQRDFKELQPVYKLLGVSVGLSEMGAKENEKREAYSKDVIYSTGFEFGFDFLRDQIRDWTTGARRLGERNRHRILGSRKCSRAQSQLNFAVIDELDSVLIDEATSPLVLSDNSSREDGHMEPFVFAQQAQKNLEEGTDFEIEHSKGHIIFSDRGLQKTFELRVEYESSKSWPATLELGQTILRNMDSKPHNAASMKFRRPWHEYIGAALKANHVLKNGKDYIVQEGKVLIVDQYTGRIFDDRTWQDGLHQAVEAKEQVEITNENHLLAMITRHRFFGSYRNMCGLTGTVVGIESELQRRFDLRLLRVPTHRPRIRKVLPTLYFSNTETMENSLVDAAISKSRQGRPVLIGTESILQSKSIAARLESYDVSFQLLNGVQDSSEAEIVAQAGVQSKITVATNMAGRGTDIRLCSNSKTAGGLHVIGCGRSTSRRVDQQLAGRAGRQGDPGSSQFYVSPEDDLVKSYAQHLIQKLKRIEVKCGMKSRYFDNQIHQAQLLAEKEFRRQRENVDTDFEFSNNILDFREAR